MHPHSQKCAHKKKLYDTHRLKTRQALGLKQALKHGIRLTKPMHALLN
jgi:hypothetical protein